MRVLTMIGQRTIWLARRPNDEPLIHQQQVAGVTQTDGSDLRCAGKVKYSRRRPSGVLVVQEEAVEHDRMKWGIEMPCSVT
jgi:hypothetical protein